MIAPSREVLEHYVQKRLSPAEEEQVELWLMDHPDALDELYLDQTLKMALTDIGPSLHHHRQGKSWFGMGWLFPLATAAMGALAVGVLMVVFEQPATPGGIAAAPAYLSLETSMSGSPAAAARINRADPYLLLDLDVGSAWSDHEQLDLLISANGELLQRVRLSESEPGFAQVVISAAGIPGDRVLLMVVGVDGAVQTEVTSYRLEVVDQ